MNTFDTGLSYLRTPFIGSVVLFGVGAVLIDLSTRFAQSPTIVGLIGFSLLSATLIMPVKLAQLARFIFSFSDDAPKATPSEDEHAHFRKLLKNSMAPSPAGPVNTSAECSEGHSNGDKLTNRSIV